MRLFRFRAFWSLVLVIIVYLVFARVTPIRPRGESIRAILLVLSGWGMFAYWRPFKMAILSDGWPDAPGWYAIAIFGICAAINFNCAVAIFWRLAGQPAFLVNNAVYDFWIVLAIVVFAILVSVPNLFGKGVPPLDRIQLGSAWMVMFLLVSYLVLVRPNLDPLADAVRPWLDNGYNYEPD
jgi:hypothetical protein